MSFLENHDTWQLTYFFHDTKGEENLQSVNWKTRSLAKNFLIVKCCLRSSIMTMISSIHRFMMKKKEIIVALELVLNFYISLSSTLASWFHKKQTHASHCSLKLRFRRHILSVKCFCSSFLWIFSCSVSLHFLCCYLLDKGLFGIPFHRIFPLCTH